MAYSDSSRRTPLSALRASAIVHDGGSAPPGPTEAGRFFEDESGRNLGPNFAAHFDSRRAGGALSAAAAEHRNLRVWLRHRDRVVRNSGAGLVALADALPPAAMALMNEPGPVRTMTWQLDMLTDAPRAGYDWWICRATADGAVDGYAAQSMAIWNRDGQPVAVGRQSSAVFA